MKFIRQLPPNISSPSYIDCYGLLIEKVIQARGYNPVDTRLCLDSSHERLWVVQMGATQITIMINAAVQPGSNTLDIEVISPILRLCLKGKLPSGLTSAQRPGRCPSPNECSSTRCIYGIGKYNCCVSLSEGKLLVTSKSPLEQLNFAVISHIFDLVENS
jgi:hypothetical protein